MPTAISRNNHRINHRPRRADLGNPNNHRQAVLAALSSHLQEVLAALSLPVAQVNQADQVNLPVDSDKLLPHQVAQASQAGPASHPVVLVGQASQEGPEDQVH